MVDFLLYQTSLYKDLTNISTPILTATNNTCYVNSIIVCNTSPNTITVNLTKTVVNNPDQTVFLIKALEIPAANNQSLSTVNLINFFGIEIFLPGNQSIASSINICAGGLNQKFDCTVDYTIFSELSLANLN